MMMVRSYSSYLFYALLVGLAAVAVSQNQWRLATAWMALILLRWLMREGQKYLQDSIVRSLLGLTAALACVAWFMYSVFLQAQYWIRR